MKLKTANPLIQLPSWSATDRQGLFSQGWKKNWSLHSSRNSTRLFTLLKLTVAEPALDCLQTIWQSCQQVAELLQY